MSDEKIELLVRGRLYGGWKSVRLTRSIEQLAGSFSLSVSEKWANQPQPWPISEHDECTVLVDGVPVITGYAHRAAPSFDTSQHTLAVDGRDKACDLVDCSAQLGTWSFVNVNVLDLATKIATPFGVRVRLQTGLVAQTVTVPKKYSIDPGDTAATALHNLCAMAGLLPISDGVGGIVLTRAGTERVATVIVEGLNMLPSGAVFDSSERFRNYEVAGSHKGRDDLSGAEAAGVKGTATDLNVRATRTLIVRPDTSVTRALANQRATWEATTRAAKGETLNAAVRGWRESPFDAVWPLNKLVRVKSPTLRIDGDMLIVGTTQTRDLTGGTVTQLDLRNPRAYIPDPTIAKAGGGNNFWREIVNGV